jgi:superfamily II DNA/RNA helicase
LKSSGDFDFVRRDRGQVPGLHHQMSFSDLGLSQKVLAAVEASGYVTPTPIQAQAIPHVLTRRDVLGIAQTGTGKTASFVLPMLTLLEQGRARARMPRTLILEPTRELAAQVEENFVRYGRNNKLTVALIIGGVSFDDQIKKLDRGVDVLIATPGRLLDLFERGKLLMQGVEILVIDEADRMLDMGFIPDIERICKLLPFTRQTLFFSATMPNEIQRLADNFLSNPIRIEASRPATAATTVAQRLVTTGKEPAEKRAVLRALIRGADNFKNAIIFCNRKRDVATLQRSLARHGFNAGALHGDMDQRSRTATLDDFRKDRLTLLVASDVAARGLDIPAVSHIFNFDVPTHAEDYIHRIGRTGRAGLTGTAITIAAPIDRKYVAAIEKLTGQPIEPIEVEASAERAASVYGNRGSAEGESAGREERRGRGRGRDRQSGRGEHRAPRHDAAPAPAASAPEAAPAPAPVMAQPSPERSEQPAPQQPRQAERAAPRPDRHGQQRPPQHQQRDHRNEPRRDRNDRRPRDREDREPMPVGLGDHVPQFLLRPTKVPVAES